MHVRAADRRAGLGRGRPPRPRATDVPGSRAGRTPAGADRRRPPSRLPDLDDPAFGATVRPLRRPPGRAARRGEPRHLGVLSRPRRDHAPADRAARLHASSPSRPTGPTPRAIDRYVRAPARRVPAPSRRSSASRPGCGATPRSPRSSSGCARHNARLPSRAARRLLRPRPLQPARLDRAPCSTISTRSIPKPAKVARERYGCLTPWQKEPADLRPRRAERRAIADCEQRGGRTAARPAATSGSTMPRSDGERFLDAAQNARLVACGRALLPHHVLRRRRVLEPARHAHVRNARRTCSRRAGRRRKAVVWAHNSHIGDARHTEMGRVRDELNIGQLCRERFGDEAALIGFGTHTGTVAAARTGTARWRSRRVRPSHRRQLRAAVPRRAAYRASCSICDQRRHGAATPAAGAAAGALHRRDLSAGDRAARATIPRRRCRSSSTPTSGSTRPAPSTRLRHRRICQKRRRRSRSASDRDAAKCGQRPGSAMDRTRARQDTHSDRLARNRQAPRQRSGRCCLSSRSTTARRTKAC